MGKHKGGSKWAHIPPARRAIYAALDAAGYVQCVDGCREFKLATGPHDCVETLGAKLGNVTAAKSLLLVLTKGAPNEDV